MTYAYDIQLKRKQPIVSLNCVVVLLYSTCAHLNNVPTHRKYLKLEKFGRMFCFCNGIFFIINKEVLDGHGSL